MPREDIREDKKRYRDIPACVLVHIDMMLFISLEYREAEATTKEYKDTDETVRQEKE